MRDDAAMTANRERADPKEVPEDFDGARLDRAVRKLFGTTWNRARDWIEKGKISIGGIVVTECAVAVRAGSTVRYTEDSPRLRKAMEIGEESIVYLDTHVIVVDKPAGISTVPFEKGETNTLDRAVRDYLSRRFKRSARRKGARQSLFVVHRLDRGTSGLIVFARTVLAKQHLSLQFREHSTRRRYLALAHGRVDSRTIRSHLLVDRGDGLRGSSETSPHRGVRCSGGGKLAVTHVEALEFLKIATLISCRLETGRTNQIRIHLAEAGHPLLGETIYLRGFKGDEISVPRLMLHAAELGFIHPVTGEALRFSQPLPEDMAEVFKRLGDDLFARAR
jgi:23S rRNA pseudouridine1911/1915/1917 synthase